LGKRITNHNLKIRNQKLFINGQKKVSRMKINKVILCSVGGKNLFTKPGQYRIGGFAEGTYTGPATAPTGLIMTEGLGLASGGNWQGYLYIDAVPVPEPATLALAGLGGLVALIAARRGK
jgi:hypothetical protein